MDIVDWSVSFLKAPDNVQTQFQITALKASTDNRAQTVLNQFFEAVDKHGMPSRMRGDRGSENIAVSIYMVMMNGPNRASFIWGSYVIFATHMPLNFIA